MGSGSYVTQTGSPFMQSPRLQGACQSPGGPRVGGPGHLGVHPSGLGQICLLRPGCSSPRLGATLCTPPTNQEHCGASVSAPKPLLGESSEGSALLLPGAGGRGSCPVASQQPLGQPR